LAVAVYSEKYLALFLKKGYGPVKQLTGNASPAIALVNHQARNSADPLDPIKAGLRTNRGGGVY
jgi:hypothetical protein